MLGEQSARGSGALEDRNRANIFVAYRRLLAIKSLMVIRTAPPLKTLVNVTSAASF